MAALLSGGAPAQGVVDTKCLERWNQAVSVAHVAQKCGYGDAAFAAKLKQLEQQNLECAAARVSATEKAEIADKAGKTKAELGKQLATMPCGVQAKQFFDAQAAQLR